MDESNKWYQDDTGHVSAMRITLVPASYIGSLGFIAGVIMAFLGNPFGTGIAGISAGMATVLQGAKALQKRFEA